MNRWSIAALGLAAACAHAPPSRPASPREMFTFDAIEVCAPAEAGWAANDWVVGNHRELTLVSTVSTGRAVRQAWVKEQEIRDRPPTPEEFLELTRTSAEELAPGATLAPSRPGHEAVSLDDRFGPLSARISFFVNPDGDGTAAADGTLARYMRYAFIPPGWPERLYLVQYGESDLPAAPEERFDERARTFFDEVRLRPPRDPDVAGPSEGGKHDHQSFALGAGAWRLRGVAFTGAGMRLGSGFTRLAGPPRGRAGIGGDLQLTINAGADSTGERSAVVGTIAVLAFLFHGPLRVGGGLDLGAAAIDRLDARGTIAGFVIGPRAFASVDLFRWRTSTFYLTLDGLAATPSLFQATALVGFR